MKVRGEKGSLGGHPPQGTKHVMPSRIEEEWRSRISRATAGVPGGSGTSKHESKERSSNMTPRNEESRQVLRMEILEKKVS